MKRIINTDQTQIDLTELTLDQYEQVINGIYLLDNTLQDLLPIKGQDLKILFEKVGISAYVLSSAFIETYLTEKGFKDKIYNNNAALLRKELRDNYETLNQIFLNLSKPA